MIGISDADLMQTASEDSSAISSSSKSTSPRSAGSGSQIVWSTRPPPSQIANSIAGWLLKRHAHRKLLSHQWGRRYFVLDSEEGTLRYYCSSSATVPRSVFELADLSVVKDLGSLPNTFQIVSNASSLQLTVRAENRKDFVMWTSHLTSHATRCASQKSAPPLLILEPKGVENGVIQPGSLYIADDEQNGTGNTEGRAASRLSAARASQRKSAGVSRQDATNSHHDTKYTQSDTAGPQNGTSESLPAASPSDLYQGNGRCPAPGMVEAQSTWDGPGPSSMLASRSMSTSPKAGIDVALNEVEEFEPFSDSEDEVEVGVKLNSDVQMRETVVATHSASLGESLLEFQDRAHAALGTSKPSNSTTSNAIEAFEAFSDSDDEDEDHACGTVAQISRPSGSSTACEPLPPSVLSAESAPVMGSMGFLQEEAADEAQESLDSMPQSPSEPTPPAGDSVMPWLDALPLYTEEELQPEANVSAAGEPVDESDSESNCSPFIPQGTGSTYILSRARDVAVKADGQDSEDETGADFDDWDDEADASDADVVQATKRDELHSLQGERRGTSANVGSVQAQPLGADDSDWDDESDAE